MQFAINLDVSGLLPRLSGCFRLSADNLNSLWAGNIGAFHNESLRSSLDYRLREALQVRTQIGRTLQFLDSSLRQGLDLLLELTDRMLMGI